MKTSLSEWRGWGPISLEESFLFEFWAPCKVLHYRENTLKSHERNCVDALFLFSKIRLGKCSNPHVTYAWHGASKEVISQILASSSDSWEELRDCSSYRALHLSQDPENCAIDRLMVFLVSSEYKCHHLINVNCSIASAKVNGNGVKHVLFCRVFGPQISQKFMAWNLYVD